MNVEDAYGLELGKLYLIECSSKSASNFDLIETDDTLIRIGTASAIQNRTQFHLQ